MHGRLCAGGGTANTTEPSPSPQTQHKGTKFGPTATGSYTGVPKALPSRSPPHVEVLKKRIHLNFSLGVGGSQCSLQDLIALSVAERYSDSRFLNPFST